MMARFTSFDLGSHWTTMLSMALMLIIAKYQLAAANAGQASAAFPVLPANMPGTADQAWAIVLRQHHHAIASQLNTGPILAAAAGANLVAVLPHINARSAELATAEAITMAFDNTNDGAVGTARPAGANLPTSTVGNICTAIGNVLHTHTAAYQDHMFQALTATAQPAPAQPAPPGQPQQVNVIPTFVSKMPEFDGTDVKAFRPWMLRIWNLITAQFLTLPTDLLVAQKVCKGLNGRAIEAAETSMPTPPANTPNTNTSKLAHFNCIMQWLQDTFGNPNEVLNATWDFQALRQKDLPFGAFYVEFRTLRALAGLSMADADVVDSLWAKITTGLRSWPTIIVETDLDTLVEQCCLHDPHVCADYERTQKKTTKAKENCCWFCRHPSHILLDCPLATDLHDEVGHNQLPRDRHATPRAGSPAPSQ